MSDAWAARINAAAQRKSRGFPGFTAQDVADANDWKSCAVDEAVRPLQGLVPLELSRRPVDETLADLGTRFSMEVSADHPRNAMTLYERIKRRVVELEKLGRS